MSGGRPRARCTHPGPCDLRAYRKNGRWHVSCRIRLTEQERKRAKVDTAKLAATIVRRHLIHSLSATFSVSEVARLAGVDRATVRHHRDGRCTCPPS